MGRPEGRPSSPLVLDRTAEIESVLGRHPMVLEAIVTTPEPAAGSFSAFVKLKPGIEPSEALRFELMDLLRQKFGPSAALDRDYFGTDLPKTRSGKIRRAVLEEIAAEQAPAKAAAPIPLRTSV